MGCMAFERRSARLPDTIFNTSPWHSMAGQQGGRVVMGRKVTVSTASKQATVEGTRREIPHRPPPNVHAHTHATLLLSVIE